MEMSQAKSMLSVKTGVTGPCRVGSMRYRRRRHQLSHRSYRPRPHNQSSRKRARAASYTVMEMSQAKSMLSVKTGVTGPCRVGSMRYRRRRANTSQPKLKTTYFGWIESACQ
jgi:hypothetical protein